MSWQSDDLTARGGEVHQVTWTTSPSVSYSLKLMVVVRVVSNFQVKFGQWKYAVKAVTGLWLIGGSLILAPLIFTALGRPARWLTRKRSEISKLGILSPACQWGSVRASSNLAQIIWDGVVAWKEIFAIMENDSLKKKLKQYQMIKCAERCSLWLLVEAYKILNTFILVFTK